jgi:hypothetical protein
VDAVEEGLVANRSAEPQRWFWSDRRLPPPPDVHGFEPPPDVVTTFNADHPAPWGAEVWTYVLTKNVAAGAMLAAPFLGLLGVTPGAAWIVPEIIALISLLITLYLLVEDLGRPLRFIKILTHPNPRSWLTIGGWVLGAFGAVTAGSLGARILGLDSVGWALRWLGVPIAMMTAGYSAFLFHQCRGRDLWLEKGLFVHLVLRAFAIGAGIALVLPHTEGTGVLTGHMFIVLVLANAGWISINLTRPPETPDGAKAHAILNSMRRPQVALALLAVAAPMGILPAVVGGQLGQVLGIVSLLIAGTGDFQYERAWIWAGQKVPLS